MSTASSEEQRWQQPAFDASSGVSPDAAEPTFNAELEPVDTASGVLSPTGPVSPPTVVESSLNVISAVAWPVAIGLVFLGVGGWMINLIAAFVVTAAASSIATELKKRRGLS